MRDPERGSVAAATSECSSATRVWRAVAPVDEQLGDLMPSASCRVGEYAAARSSAAPTVIVRRPRPGLRIDRPAHDRRAEVAQAPHHAEQLRRGPMSRRRRIRGPARRRATVAAGAIDRLRPRPGVRRGCCRLLLPTPKRSASAREAERQLLQKALLHDDRCRDAQRAAAPPERTAAELGRAHGAARPLARHSDRHGQVAGGRDRRGVRRDRRCRGLEPGPPSAPTPWHGRSPGCRPPGLRHARAQLSCATHPRTALGTAERRSVRRGRCSRRSARPRRRRPAAGAGSRTP